MTCLLFWYIVTAYRSFVQNYHWRSIALQHQLNFLCGIVTDAAKHGEVFLRKSVLKICSKFTGEHPCRSLISIKLQSNFIEIALRHGCSPANLLHIFRTPFPRNTSRVLLLIVRSLIARYRQSWRNIWA